MPGAEPATPLYVLTGFLGSGKTTILRRLVQRPELADTAVIVNEFGEVGLDHLLVAKGEEEDIVLLESGCLCCALNSSLGETLTDLFHRRARREIPAFRRVVVETTGLADPAPILHTLMSERFLASRFGLAGVTATLDALNFLGQIRDFKEAVKQAALADRLVVTKVDLVDAARLARVREQARALNRRAEILESASGDIAPERLLARRSFAEEAAGPREGPAAAGTRPAHPEGRHSAAVASHFRGIAAPVAWADYDAFVRYARRRMGAGLLRVKGLLRFEGERAPRVIQGVQHVFAPPEALASGAATAIGLVFIVQDLPGRVVDEAVARLTGAEGRTDRNA